MSPSLSQDEEIVVYSNIPLDYVSKNVTLGIIGILVSFQE